MADTSSASSEFECDYSSGEEAYNYNIDVPFYRGVERKILPADVVPLVLRCVSSAQVSPAAAGDAFAARLARTGAPRGAPTAAPAPAAARAPDIARIAKREGCVRGVFAAVQASHPSQACWPSIARAPSMNGVGVGALRRSKGGNVRNRGHAIGYRIINYSPGVRPTGGPPQT